MKKALIPFALFLIMAGFLFKGLFLNPREVPSPLVGKPAPAFSLPRLDQPAKTFSPKDMLGQVWLFNVWASWCGACRDEHPLLVALAKTELVPVVGMDYKDTATEAEQWLTEGGNPYLLSAVDADGRVGIDYGVYGVPETFVVNAKGVIVFKHVGPISEDSLKNEVLPAIEKAKAG